MTDISTLRIPYNWVLIKPDSNFDTYQTEGHETGIHVAPWGANQASHISVTGTVIKTPEMLIYDGDEIHYKRKTMSKDPSDQKRVAELRKASMAYNVPMELIPGDRVYYEYSTRLDAFKQGRIIDTEQGELMLVPYDILIMKFHPELVVLADVKLNQVRMLNGMVLIKPLEYATSRDMAGIKGVTTEMDIFMPITADAKYVRKDNMGWANVLSAGCLVNGYCDFQYPSSDDARMGKPGQKIMYKWKQQRRLEVEHHRIIFKDYTLFRIHRKDIVSVIEDGKLLV